MSAKTPLYVKAWVLMVALLLYTHLTRQRALRVAVRVWRAARVRVALRTLSGQAGSF